MILFEKPKYNAGKDLKANVGETFDYLGRLVEQLNKDRSTCAEQVIYSGTASSGTAVVPLETIGHSLFIAVIGGVPTLAVQSGGVIAGRGGNVGTQTALTATLAGTKLTFEASGTLDKLIVIR